MVKSFLGVVIILALLAGSVVSFFGGTSPAVAQGEDTDWSVELCDSVMARYTPETFGSWQYPQGLFLEGMWRVYQRTGDTAYYNFIKDWVDRFVTDSGLDGSIPLDRLDNMMPGVLLCHLYQATGEAKYQTAAQQIRDRIDTYPRTTDGGLVHNTWTADQLWLDGAFMLTIFLANYGEVFGDTEYCNNECTNQLIIYYSHLQYPATKLGWHAWDENGSATWADPTTHLSPEVWCRAMGWYVVACTEVLEKLPSDHANRQAVIDILVELLEGIQNYQDATTGLWYQVVDKGDLTDNWVEESSGCMYTYALSKAIDAGYIDSADYETTAKKGYEGILSNIELDITDETNLYGTCQGTDVGSPYSYYINRSQVTNDNHGQGAFLFASEQQRTKYTDLRQLYQAENGTLYQAVAETTERGFTGASYVNLGDEVGSYVEITVNAAYATAKTLVVRYANGSVADKPLEVTVNGVVASDSLSFVPTGADRCWRGQSIDISLNAGDNIIRLESVDDAGGPHIDWLALDSLPTGLLRVETSPAVATTISVGGIPRNDWGLDWVKMPPGEYTLSFTDVSGYLTPVEVEVTFYPPEGDPVTQTQPLSQTIVVDSGVTTRVVASFIPLGNLRVETSPVLPVANTIFVDGNPMNDWGLWVNLEAGEYTVSFEEMDGYLTPPPTVVSVTSGVTTHVTGDYLNGETTVNP
jgi:unsaturated rhamnogalacturonyl hydrolase